MSLPDVEAESELIPRIHFARYGEWPDFGGKSLADNQFFKELSAFSDEMKGDIRHVTIPAIRKWLNSRGPADPKRKGKVFLLAYVRALLADPVGSTVHSVERMKAIEVELASALRGLTKASIRAAAKSLDPMAAARLHNLFASSVRSIRLVDRDLFREGDPNDQTDHSYFLVYRHSTNHGSILKSFMVLQKPEPKGFSEFGFNHFIWGGEGFNDHIFRECEGAVLKLEKSYYFLGYNFVVPANKRKSPELYARLRTAYKEMPNGMGLTAVEYDDVEADPGFFPGLTMTLAAAHQPTAARVVFLHLGTKSSLGTTIFDTDVQPTELKTQRLAGDLRETIERLRAKGCRKFGMRVERLLADKPRARRGADPLKKNASTAWNLKEAAALAQDIRRMLDNTPAWETAKLKKEPTGKGAIETFGKNRPRD